MQFIHWTPNRNRLYICDENIKPQNWALVEDSIEIMNYVCYKAETFFRGRGYTAWYAKDIPVNDGPWKIYGLPGLILKLEDYEGVFSFEAYKLQSEIDKKILLPDTTNVRHRNLEFMTKIKQKSQEEVTQNIYSNNTLYYGPSNNKLTIYPIER